MDGGGGGSGCMGVFDQDCEKVNQGPLTAITTYLHQIILSQESIRSQYANYTTSRFDNSQINYCKKWKNLQAATNMLWNRQRKEYLPTLTQRKKGLVRNRNFKIEDLVITNESNFPRSYWPLGRTIETFPGQDGVVCTVKVKSPNNEFIRPGNKLHLLEASDWSFKVTFSLRGENVK